MTNQLNEILRRLKSLAPFPQVAPRVLSLSSNPDVTPDDIVQVIQSDVGISARVLREANSALSGSRVELGSVQEAGNRLGIRRLVRLVMSACARDCFNGLGSSTPRTNRTLWEESVTTACSARFIARRAGAERVDLAYTCGLMQNIGHLVLDRYLSGHKQEIAQRMTCASETPGPERVLQVEREVIGIDHAELGARLAAKWNFPGYLVDAIRNHHTPQAAEIDPDMCLLAHEAEVVTWSLLSEVGVYAEAYGLTDEDRARAWLGESGESGTLIAELSDEGILPVAA